VGRSLVNEAKPLGEGSSRAGREVHTRREYTRDVTKPVRDDLFALFPDLPGIQYRAPEERIRKIHEQVQATRARARVNIERQRTTTVRMQAQIAERKRRRSR